ncbi:hypothetical protein CRV11_02340 [Candidatus Pantoea edessiphila]|uniref:Phage holin family protein n=1 Tax=Candidatus Pantoea edessiphila TaxID=2044610 RepID=A0A2P5SXT1_9GAMM|nr:phage holin family protein [Candidatus Pantoea edessiphila]MBK4775739.1 hypothetical protein [Pantoea sp. Edef]PPI87135.1 hypothetical protein CRV11_02340 [Candidatus Pantoea edessiphila]
MDTSKNKQIPSSSIIEITQDIITKIIEMIETRLHLASAEIEEEKSKILQILLMILIMFMFIFFGGCCLLMVVVWSVKPQYRIMTMTTMSVVLFLFSFFFGLRTFRKFRESTVLKYSCKELKTDQSILKDKN